MRYATVVCVIGLWVIPAIVAEAADPPPLEFSGGFSVLSPGAPCGLPTRYTTPTGWDTGIAVHLWERLTALGTVGGDHQTVTLNFRGAPALHARTYAFLAGPRVTVHPARNVSVFGQVLFGATHRRATVSAPSALLGDLAVSHFTWQPGGGVDIGLSRRWAVRLEGGYRFTPVDVLVFTAVRAQGRFAPSLVFRP